MQHTSSLTVISVMMFHSCYQYMSKLYSKNVHEVDPAFFQFVLIAEINF
jgi:hypothetical protein